MKKKITVDGHCCDMCGAASPPRWVDGLERGKVGDMGNAEDRARFFAWWDATGGGNTSLRAVAWQAFMCAARLERTACVAICRDVAERYPTDIFPEDGQSLDCKSARMARLTAANIEREIAERSNAKLTGVPPTDATKGG